MEKILFILKIPPPVHGSTLMNLNVFNSELIREKFDAHYFSLSLNKDMNHLGRLKWYKIKKTIQDYFRLSRELKAIKPSLVYFAVSPVGFALIKDFIFYRIIRMHGIPVVFHHHGKGVKSTGERNKFFNYVYSRMFARSYHICLSKELVADLSPYLKTNPFIVPNGIRDEAVKINGKDGEEDSACRILYLSNFTVNKGILDVIEACTILKEQQLNFQLQLVGKSFDISEDEIGKRIGDLGLSHHIKVVGPKYDDEKFKILGESDFFVFPTKYERESFPLVILEAMQAGLPVISTREGGIPSMIDNDVDGYLVNKNDVVALADRMSYLIKRPDIIESMGRRAREKYESSYTLEKFETCLTQAIDLTLQNISEN